MSVTAFRMTLAALFVTVVMGMAFAIRPSKSRRRRKDDLVQLAIEKEVSPKFIDMRLSKRKRHEYFHVDGIESEEDTDEDECEEKIDEDGTHEKPFHFAGLPRELRDQILEECLVPQVTIPIILDTNYPWRHTGTTATWPAHFPTDGAPTAPSNPPPAAQALPPQSQMPPSVTPVYGVLNPAGDLVYITMPNPVQGAVPATTQQATTAGQNTTQAIIPATAPLQANAGQVTTAANGQAVMPAAAQPAPQQQQQQLPDAIVRWKKTVPDAFIRECAAPNCLLANKWLHDEYRKRANLRMCLVIKDKAEYAFHPIRLPVFAQSVSKVELHLAFFCHDCSHYTHEPGPNTCKAALELRFHEPWIRMALNSVKDLRSLVIHSHIVFHDRYARYTKSSPLPCEVRIKAGLGKLLAMKKLQLLTVYRCNLSSRPYFEGPKELLYRWQHGEEEMDKLGINRSIKQKASPAKWPAIAPVGSSAVAA